MVEQPERAVPVRVKKHDAFSRLDILGDEPLEECALAGTGFPDGVEVVPAIALANAEGSGLPARTRCAPLSM